MAGRAGSRKSQVISDGRVLVALIALQDGMRAEQRESVEVLLNRLDGNLPPKDGMALGAVLAELGTVNVGVTIGAVFSNVRKNRFDVASRAGYFFVHATQRVARGVVVEFWNGTNGGPAGVGMAIFAGNVEWTVRTSARLPLGGCGQDNG